jgi:drug/metabolite transporter (DMT)-like permease
MTRISRMVIVYAVAVVAFLAGYGGGSLVLSRLFHLRNSDVRGVIAAAVAGALVGGVLVVGRRWARSDPTNSRTR